MANEQAVQTTEEIEKKLDKAISSQWSDVADITRLAKNLKGAAGDEKAGNILGQKLHTVLDESSKYSPKDNEGLSPGRTVELTDALLENGANVHTSDSKGMLPLDKALITFGTEDNLIREKLVLSLLTRGADPNRPDADGNTTLHKLATMRDPHEDGAEVAKKLVVGGANPIAYNKQSQTAADLSVTKGVNDVLVAAEQEARGASLSKPQMRYDLYDPAEKGDLEKLKAKVTALRASYGDKGMDKTLGNALMETIRRGNAPFEQLKPVVTYLLDQGAERRPEYLKTAIDRGDDPRTKPLVDLLLEKKVATEGALHRLIASSGYKDNPDLQTAIAGSLIAGGADATEKIGGGLNGHEERTPAQRLRHNIEIAKIYSPDKPVPDYSALLEVLDKAEIYQARQKREQAELAKLPPVNDRLAKFMGQAGAQVAKSQLEASRREAAALPVNTQIADMLDQQWQARVTASKQAAQDAPKQVS